MRDSQHTQNIHINKVIVENENSVFYFIEKKLNGLLGQANISYSIGKVKIHFFCFIFKNFKFGFFCVSAFYLERFDDLMIIMLLYYS